MTGWALILGALANICHAQAPEKPTIPDPEDLTLKTKDLVQLQCTFYPGGFRQAGEDVETVDGKTVVPILLVHGWDEKRQDLSFLAKGLQSLGHAVMVPDLRGHGRSTKRVDLAGKEHELDRERFRRQDIAAMVEDLWTCKRHLMALNNEGKLNIEMLTVIGGEVGAITALNFVALDWSRPPLPTMKQGQDVKAFILLSPETSFKGVTAQQALRQPAVAGEVDGLIIVGARDKAVNDVQRMYDQLSRHRKEDERDLFLLKPDTSLTGFRMVPARGLNVGVAIIKFINARIVTRADEYPWRDRTSFLNK
ncbi:MAG: alpha/beta fold hydrolase [Planctomycetales bacterium]|nr:alpha/beta fold hydrolase [Planctomycetales bacterium]